MSDGRGRAPGEKLGGRQKGTKNKATLEHENLISRAMGKLDGPLGKEVLAECMIEFREMAPVSGPMPGGSGAEAAGGVAGPTPPGRVAVEAHRGVFPTPRAAADDGPSVARSSAAVRRARRTRRRSSKRT